MLDRAAAIGKRHDIMAGRLQHTAHDAPDARLVVDHENLGHDAYFYEFGSRTIPVKYLVHSSCLGYYRRTRSRCN